MVSIPPTIAAEMAMTRQNVALSVIKQSADQQKAIVGILDQAIQNSEALNASGRGSNFNSVV